MAYLLIIIGALTILFGVKILLLESSAEQGRKWDETLANSPRKSIQYDNPASVAPVPTSELTAKEKGNQFENYIADLFNEKNGFKLLEWNQGSTSPSGNYAENELKPDFHIRRNLIKRKPYTFWLECKYRSNINNGFSLPDYQIKRYQVHQKSTRRKVLIALGVGNTPSSPATLYIIPLDSLHENLSLSSLSNYIIASPAQDSKNKIDDYFFNFVFSKNIRK